MSPSAAKKRVVHVEVVRKPTSTLTSDQLRPYLLQYVEKYGLADYLTGSAVDVANLDHIESISCCQDLIEDGAPVEGEAEPRFHVFTLEDSGPELQELEEKEDQVAAATHWQLPSAEFHGLWETLVYDSDVKLQLLNFVQTTMLFSDRHVDSNIIAWNRVVLLHGPPGTGKTSLCKALAQKVAIRLNHRYQYSQLVEINSHSLFSKWFSESGKLVMKMFAKIQELVEDAACLVVVLIDEVESLARARGSNGGEPSDSIRVVNALLTQIDQIKRYPNVLILTTSNISGTIDLAFVDRADIKQFVGLPAPPAIRAIYTSCFKELFRTGFLQSTGLADDLQQLKCPSTDLGRRLTALAKMSQGLSGRTLRKMPFLAYSLAAHSTAPGELSPASFLDAMERTIQKQFDDRQLMAAAT